MACAGRYSPQTEQSYLGRGVHAWQRGPSLRRDPTERIRAQETHISRLLFRLQFPQTGPFGVRAPIFFSLPHVTHSIIVVRE